MRLVISVDPTLQCRRGVGRTRLVSELVRRVGSQYSQVIHLCGASPATWHRAPFILEKPGEAWFDVNMMQKDMQLALELGKQLDVPLPTTGLTNEFLTAAYPATPRTPR